MATLFSGLISAEGHPHLPYSREKSKTFQLNRHPVRGESIFTRLVHFSWTRSELSLCLQAKSLKGRE